MIWFLLLQLNINIENSDGSISALFGYLSFDMLNILNSNGSLPLSAILPANIEIIDLVFLFNFLKLGIKITRF